MWPTSETSSTPQSSLSEASKIMAKKTSINLALSPIENDLLTMNIKEGGEANYNIHELPNNDGKWTLCLFTDMPFNSPPVNDTFYKVGLFQFETKYETRLKLETVTDNERNWFKQVTSLACGKPRLFV